MKTINSTIAMEPTRVVVRTGDMETAFACQPSAAGPQVAVAAADQIAILQTVVCQKNDEMKQLRADLELVLSHLQWCNVNAGQAYVLRGVPYSHLLYWPLEFLKRRLENEGGNE